MISGVHPQAPSGREFLTHELELRHFMIDLVVFGARPKLIYSLLGKQIPGAEVSRCYRLATRRVRRTGRLPDRRKIAGLSKPDSALLARLLAQVRQASGFDPIDVLLATWRVHQDAVEAAGSAKARCCGEAVDFELFVAAVQNLRIGMIDIRQCGYCCSPNIIIDCDLVVCSSCGKRNTPLRLPATVVPMSLAVVSGKENVA